MPSLSLSLPLSLSDSLSASPSLPPLVSSIVFYLRTRGTFKLSGDAAKLDSGLVLNLCSSRNSRKQQEKSRLTLSLSQLMEAASSAAAFLSEALSLLLLSNLR